MCSIPYLIPILYLYRYVAVFDPLDGSSNIDAAISTGTIFGIFLEDDECLIDPEQDISQQQMACLLNTLQVRYIEWSLSFRMSYCRHGGRSRSDRKV